MNNGLPVEKKSMGGMSGLPSFGQNPVSSPTSGSAGFGGSEGISDNWAAWGSPSGSTNQPASNQQDLFAAFGNSPAANSPAGGLIAESQQLASPFGAWNSQPPKAKNVAKFVASFNFEARNADELSFVEGDVLEIDLDAAVEPEWYFGTKNGQGGLFPQAGVGDVKR